MNKTQTINVGSVKTSGAVNTRVNRLKKYSDAFVSIQLEKNPYRDLMLNEFVKQKESKGLLLSNPNEMEKLKRSLMNDFADKFSQRVWHYSLRAQLITLYYSITKLLENFPNTRNNHFVFGEPYEKQLLANAKKDEADGEKKVEITEEYVDFLEPDARQFKKRPRKLLSDDGKRVLNVWFIPHFTELLTMYKKNHSDEFVTQTLKYCVRIISALNDIMQFFYATAGMNISMSSGSGDSSASQIRRKVDFSTWENTGGLETELNEIQQEMNKLNDPCDPEQVAELLEMKRHSLFLQYDCAVRYSVRDIFLSIGNAEAFRIVNENMQFALKFFNDYQVDTFENVYLSVPEPLDARDTLADQLIPWRSSIAKNGLFPHKYWPWYLIEPNVAICLTGLKETDKYISI